MDKSKDKPTSIFSEETLKLVEEVEKELNDIDEELRNLKLPEFDTLGVPSLSIEELKDQTTYLLSEIIPPELQTPEIIQKIRTEIVDYNTEGIIQLNTLIKQDMTESDMLYYSIKEIELDNSTIEKIKDLVFSVFPKDDPAVLKYMNHINNTVETNKKHIEDLKVIQKSL